MSTNTQTNTPIKENWAEQKSRLKVKFPILNDIDMEYDEGKKDEMLEKVRIKLNKTPNEMAKILYDISKTHHNKY